MPLAIHFLLFTLLLAPSAGSLAEAGSGDNAVRVVPVIEEPLHIVRYHSDRFLIYTNWIEPGTWTQYHEHRNDLLAVIVADTSAASQALYSEPRMQSANAGTLVLFPYSDESEPYVHRVGATGDTTFINVGLEFLQPLAASCHSNLSSWNEPHALSMDSTRRGRGYRLSLPAEAEVNLPQGGSALLLAPMSDGNLLLDRDSWSISVGGFRFFEENRPRLIKNRGPSEISLVVFQAC